MKNQKRIIGLVILAVGVISLLSSWQGITGYVVSEDAGFTPVKLLSVLLIFVGFMVFILNPNELGKEVEHSFKRFKGLLEAKERRKMGDEEALSRFNTAYDRFEEKRIRFGNGKHKRGEERGYINPSVLMAYDAGRN